MNRQLFNAMVARYGEKTVTSANDVIEWSDGAHCYLPSLKFYGGCLQSGTPDPDEPVNIYDHVGVYKVNLSQDYIRLPNLRGVGEYKDEWDYVTGKGIRRIGERVLTGTENWKKYHWKDGEGFYSYRMEIKSFNTSGEKCICTHYAPLSGYASLYYGRVEGAYVGTVADDKSWLVIGNSFPTVSEFKAFLAEQYANGTPVTVYYALAEPIPFEERPQPYVPIPNDSGNISFVDGNVSGAPFELTYITHS